MAAMTAEARRRKVAELRGQGMSYREIGRTLGISHELARRDARLTALTAAPSSLGPRGQAFWDWATGALEIDRHETELLTQVCRLLDRADQLQAQVLADGPMVTSARGDLKTHPAIGEERQVSLAIGRLLAQLAIPAEDDDAPALRTPWQARASKAARSRWDRHNRLRALREANAR